MNQALDVAIDVVGGVANLAQACGVTRQAIMKWRRRRVPAERVASIEHATAGAVSREQLRPDLFLPTRCIPPPTANIPCEVAGPAAGVASGKNSEGRHPCS